MKRIVVFGANGNLGREICREFHNAGWKVRAATRDGTYQHIAGVEAVKIDAMDRQQMIDAAKNCDIIFNGLNPQYTKWNSLCMPIAQNVLESARINSCVHLFPGNVYNYGSNIPEFLTRKSPFIGDHDKAQIRIDMEAMFERFAHEQQVQTIIVRAGDFFGGSRTGSTWFDLQITKKLHKGVFSYPGPISNIHTFAYLPDLANTFYLIANRTKELEKFETFLMRGHAITGDQMKTAFESLLDKKLTTAKIPWGIMRIMGIFSPMIKEVCKMSYLWTKPHEMNDPKLSAFLGKVQHTPLKLALKEAMEKLGMEELSAKHIQQAKTISA